MNIKRYVFAAFVIFYSLPTISSNKQELSCLSDASAKRQQPYLEVEAIEALTLLSRQQGPAITAQSSAKLPDEENSYHQTSTTRLGTKRVHYGTTVQYSEKVGDEFKCSFCGHITQTSSGASKHTITHLIGYYDCACGEKIRSSSAAYYHRATALSLHKLRNIEYPPLVNLISRFQREDANLVQLASRLSKLLESMPQNLLESLSDMEISKISRLKSSTILRFLKYRGEHAMTIVPAQDVNK